MTSQLLLAIALLAENADAAAAGGGLDFYNEIETISTQSGADLFRVG